MESVCWDCYAKKNSDKCNFHGGKRHFSQVQEAYFTRQQKRLRLSDQLNDAVNDNHPADAVNDNHPAVDNELPADAVNDNNASDVDPQADALNNSGSNDGTGNAGNNVDVDPPADALNNAGNASNNAGNDVKSVSDAGAKDLQGNVAAAQGNNTSDVQAQDEDIVQGDVQDNSVEQEQELVREEKEEDEEKEEIEKVEVRAAADEPDDDEEEAEEEEEEQQQQEVVRAAAPIADEPIADEPEEDEEDKASIDDQGEEEAAADAIPPEYLYLIERERQRHAQVMHNLEMEEDGDDVEESTGEDQDLGQDGSNLDPADANERQGASNIDPANANERPDAYNIDPANANEGQDTSRIDPANGNYNGGQVAHNGGEVVEPGANEDEGPKLVVCGLLIHYTHPGQTQKEAFAAFLSRHHGVEVQAQDIKRITEVPKAHEARVQFHPNAPCTQRIFDDVRRRPATGIATWISTDDSLDSRVMKLRTNNTINNFRAIRGGFEIQVSEGGRFYPVNESVVAFFEAQEQP